MALVLKDRVKETSTSSGTGSITLGGAIPGYQTFNSVVATGSTVYYCIHNLSAGYDTEWEVGVGTFTATATLSRDTVLSSSSGGSKVNFTAGANGLEVFITYPSEQAIYTNQASGKVEASGNGTNSISFVAITSDLFTGNGSAISSINASNISSGTIGNAYTTASSSNSANTIALRDTNGSFSANIITANGSAITSINASSISTGTIDNARTTASSSNGASTIVARDAGGNFSANTITANVSGSGSGLTSINASNISSGTISNAYTTANSSNGASTIVLRGTSGEFAAGAITGTSFSGNGSAITAINASAITTGTIDNARTTAASANGASTIVARDANGSFAGNVVTGTTGTFTSVSGNGVALTAINASNITSGTIDNARTSATTANGASTIVLRDANGSFAGNVITGTTGTFTSVSGNGVALTAINASNISSGTIDNARTTASASNGASTIVLRDASGDFSADVITANGFTGNGSALTAINASNISSGTVGTARLGTGTANSTTYLAGNSTWQALAAPNNGTLSMGVSGTGLSGSATFTADQASNSTFTVTINSSSSNGASTVVARDAGGNFAAATITATGFSGSGASLTSIPNSATTANSANGASTIVARDANGSFTANVGTFTTIAGSLSTASQTTITATGTLTNLQATSFGCGTAASGTAGEIRATNNVTAYYSDDRMKINLGNIPDALAKLKTLNGFYYEANDIAQAMGYEVKKEVGVSAQQVQAIMPEVVAPAPINDKYLTVRYERLVPLLIEAIKELEAQVAELKAR